MLELKLEKVDIIEIGGGYGGLCFYIHKLAHLFNITINTYSIFDLKQALQLQGKYLAALHIKGVQCLELDNIKGLQKDSFLISNYAFSEISMDLQKRYIDTVLTPYVSYGFLAWNAINVYQFIDKTITVEDDYPPTNHAFHKFVRFR